jgi:hypothetical protein
MGLKFEASVRVALTAEPLYGCKLIRIYSKISVQIWILSSSYDLVVHLFFCCVACQVQRCNINPSCNGTLLFFTLLNINKLMFMALTGAVDELRTFLSCLQDEAYYSLEREKRETRSFANYSTVVDHGPWEILERLSCVRTRTGYSIWHLNAGSARCALKAQRTYWFFFLLWEFKIKHI